MTSNLGAESTAKSRSLGFISYDAKDEASREDQLKRSNQALKNTFRPEFINRIDEVVVFNPLDEACIRKITRLMLDEVKNRIQNINYSLDFDESVIDLVAHEGFDAKYGARPLRRAIIRLIEDNFANMLLESKIQAGDKFVAKASDGKIEFIKEN